MASRNEKRPSIIWCRKYFDILNRLGMTHKHDGQTDLLIANAALHYIARPTKPQQREVANPMRSISVRSRSSAWRITCMMCSCSSNVSWLDRIADPVSDVCIDQPVPNLPFMNISSHNK